MINSFHRGSKFVLGLLALFIGISLICLIGDGGFLRPGGVEAKITKEPIILDQEAIALDKDHPLIRAAIAVQERHHHRLMAIPEVVAK